MSDFDKKNSSSPGLKVSDRDSIVETVTRLLSHLGDADRQIAIQKIIESLSIEPQEKASRLIDVVKNSIPSDREWTVDEIISIVKDNGLNPEKKEIYNVIGYLNRKNLIKRVGYGRYTRAVQRSLQSAV
jgi:DNA integrity scanning protein DisA with diadenylate cyclase activity